MKWGALFSCASGERRPVAASAQPNVSHRVVARLGDAGRVSALVTQNVDGLELHPDVLRDAAEPTTSSSSSGGGRFRR